MKNKLLLLNLMLFFLFIKPSFGQTFINGDFENNISTGCDFNLADIVFNTKI